MGQPDPVHITLTGHEALVLFDFLARFNQQERFPFQDQSEQRVLCDIEADLERKLSEPFDSTYEKRLAEARTQVQDKRPEG